jgi:SAM-dependent methyltransferase
MHLRRYPESGMASSRISRDVVVPDSRQLAFTDRRRAWWNNAALSRPPFGAPRRAYDARVAEIYRNLIPPDRSVLEVGCGAGDLLAAVRPRRGVGVDFSEAMIARAEERHPELTFVHADAHSFFLPETFDYIICSDLVNDLWDVQAVLENVRRHCHASSRVIVNLYSRVWELPRRLAEAVGIARKLPPQSWLTTDDVTNLLYLADFEAIRTLPEILLPFYVPLLSNVINKGVVKLWPFHFLSMTYFIVARPRPAQRPGPPPIVSVVVPARNEAGNIPAVFERTPAMGAGTELIFVEGHSSDDTYSAIEREIARRPDVRASLLRQSGKGKGDAVRAGFAAATGDLFMILDADLTVAPEDLPRFFDAWWSGKADYVNGVRLVYPMESHAMRFFNLLGNRFFSLAFSWLLGQRIKDTLCGTKVISRGDYAVIAANRTYFGEEDPFGDFDLIFGAARYTLRFVDIPVRYRDRTYGTTNIHRWSHGWLLMRMLAKALTRLKFI